MVLIRNSEIEDILDYYDCKIEREEIKIELSYYF